MENYKFIRDRSLLYRMSEGNAHNIFEIQPIDVENNTEQELIQRLIICIDLITSKLKEDVFDVSKQPIFEENMKLLLNFLYSNFPFIDNFFKDLDNDQLLFLFHSNSRSTEIRFYFLFLFHLLFIKNFIREPSKFSKIFLQYVLETIDINSELEYRCFNQTLINLVSIFHSGKEIFDEQFLYHLTEISHHSPTNENCIIDFLLKYCETIESFNENDFDEFDFLDYDFFDFMVDFIVSTDINNKEIKYEITQFLIKVLNYNFFKWLLNDKDIINFILKLIHNSIEDDTLFIMILKFVRIKGIIPSILKSIFGICLIKCKILIEIPEWSTAENDITKKIIRSFHYILILIDNRSYDENFTLLVFLLNAIEKATFKVKYKVSCIVSIFIQSLYHEKIDNDMINLIALLFTKSAELFFDIDEYAFLFLSGFDSLFNKMQQNGKFKTLQNAFLANNAVEALDNIIENQPEDNQLYDVAIEIRSMLTKNRL